MKLDFRQERGIENLACTSGSSSLFLPDISEIENMLGKGEKEKGKKSAQGIYLVCYERRIVCAKFFFLFFLPLPDSYKGEGWEIRFSGIC